MFAVIKTGGKQYRVTAEDVLKIEKIKGEPGEIVEFGEVLVVGGENTILGTPTVAGALVAGEVLDQSRGPKVIAFKKRRRKNSRRKRGHRQEFTMVRITEILTDGARPNLTPPPRVKKERPAPVAAEPAAEGDEAEAKPAKKSAKKADKKSAAKAKAPAKKPAARAGKGKQKSDK
jgi:large subunit ribosomal protein L21